MSESKHSYAFDGASVESTLAFTSASLTVMMIIAAVGAVAKGTIDDRSPSPVSIRSDGVEVMRAIKQSLDPLSIMNPGKVLETEK